MKATGINQQWLSNLGFALLLLSLIGLTTLTPLSNRLDGLSVELLLLMRNTLAEKPADAAQSPVVVIAIDEQTYRTPPFNQTPKGLWTQEIAKVQDAVMAAGASVFTYDLMLPTFSEHLIKGIEIPLIASIGRAASQGKLILGKVQHRDKSAILPNRAHQFAVGGPANIRSLNVPAESDDIIRRMPLLFDTRDGEQESSAALETTARYLDKPIEQTPDRLSIGEHLQIHLSPDIPYINFREHAIPTYSFADLYRCAEQADSDYFKRHFAGKAVFFGGVLDIEDRRLTSFRLVGGNRLGQAAPHCALPPDSTTQAHRDTSAGIYIHATTVKNLLEQDLLQEISPSQKLFGLFGVSLLVYWFTLSLKALHSLLLVTVGVLLLSGSAYAAIQHNQVLPLVPAVATMLFAYAASIFYRYSVTDRQSRHIRRSFEHYVAPSVVQQLVNDPNQLKLSGDYYETTVLFTDLVGFTTLAERLDPMALRQLLTEYFSAMVDQMLLEEGTLDKFIGDAMMCFFGVPVVQADHPERAVRTAWGMQIALQQLNREWAKRDLPQLGMRIGINSGRVVAGNMGTETLFNYTIMGDCVNLGARLESANKFYGSEILVGQATRAAVGSSFVFRHLDRAALKGKQQGIDLYELVGPSDNCPAHKIELIKDYEAALADYLRGDFAPARHTFETLAEHYQDKASRVLAERCKTLLADPPESWNGTYVWTTK